MIASLTSVSIVVQVGKSSISSGQKPSRFVLATINFRKDTTVWIEITCVCVIILRIFGGDAYETLFSVLIPLVSFPKTLTIHQYPPCSSSMPKCVSAHCKKQGSNDYQGMCLDCFNDFLTAMAVEDNQKPQAVSEVRS